MVAVLSIDPVEVVSFDAEVDVVEALEVVGATDAVVPVVSDGGMNGPPAGA